MSVTALAAHDPRRRRRMQPQPVHPLPSPPAAAVRQLPMRTVGVGASVAVGGWMIPVAGAVVGGLLLGLPGALVGAVGGYLLARG